MKYDNQIGGISVVIVTLYTLGEKVVLTLKCDIFGVGHISS